MAKIGTLRVTIALTDAEGQPIGTVSKYTELTDGGRSVDLAATSLLARILRGDLFAAVRRLADVRAESHGKPKDRM